MTSHQSSVTFHVFCATQSCRQMVWLSTTDSLSSKVVLSKALHTSQRLGMLRMSVLLEDVAEQVEQVGELQCVSLSSAGLSHDSYKNIQQLPVRASFWQDLLSPAEHTSGLTKAPALELLSFIRDFEKRCISTKITRVKKLPSTPNPLTPHHLEQKKKLYVVCRGDSYIDIIYYCTKLAAFQKNMISISSTLRQSKQRTGWNM